MAVRCRGQPYHVDEFKVHNVTRSFEIFEMNGFKVHRTRSFVHSKQTHEYNISISQQNGARTHS